MAAILSAPRVYCGGHSALCYGRAGRAHISGVYAFCNSWPLVKHPEFASILDDWVGAGHHVANHTHSHAELPDVSAQDFIDDIDEAENRLAPWLSQAPQRLFRHPLCHWGETPKKLRLVNQNLAHRGLTPVDVTSWAYEWTWNRAYRNALDTRDSAAIKFVRCSFLDFALAQLRFDMAAAETWFGHSVVGITLCHNVPFFADIAEDYFAHLIAAGVTFVPLADALLGKSQAAVGSVVSGKFLVLQQKLADAAGKPMPQFPPEMAGLHARIVEMAKGQTG